MDLGAPMVKTGKGIASAARSSRAVDMARQR
jgi:hypothetical protein